MYQVDSVNSCSLLPFRFVLMVIVFFLFQLSEWRNRLLTLTWMVSQHSMWLPGNTYFRWSSTKRILKDVIVVSCYLDIICVHIFRDCCVTHTFVFNFPTEIMAVSELYPANITCSKSTIETLEKKCKYYVQN